MQASQASHAREETGCSLRHRLRCLLRRPSKPFLHRCLALLQISALLGSMLQPAKQKEGFLAIQHMLQ